MARRRRRRSPALPLALLGAGALFVAGYWIGGQRGPVGGRPAAPSSGLASRSSAPPASSAARRSPAPPAREAAPARASEVESVPAARPAARAARVALVIDDLGRSQAEVDRLLALGIPLSFAVLPFEPQSSAIAERLAAGGHEVLTHLPMEAASGDSPGPNALLEDQSPERLAALTLAAIEKVPGSSGVNNHMGSRITADETAMRAVLSVIAGRGLFFLDSRTTAQSGAYDWARAAGIPTARRDVFLDDDPAEAAVATEFARLLELARERGAAIAIGHPRPATFAVLEREVPAARAAGVEFVPVSFLLERTEVNPE